MFFNTDTSRKSIFEAVASVYDKGRPGYPAEMFADLIDIGALARPDCQCLEIGSGSGQATRALLDYVASIDCVEPGAAMCAILREKFGDDARVRVHERELESFESAPRYQLVFAGNSLHWIAPDVAYRKISQVLVPGGWFVGAWNMPRLSEAVYGLAQDVVGPHDPEFSIPTAGAEQEDYFAEGFEDFERNRGFTACRHATYRFHRELAAEPMAHLIWSYVGVGSMAAAEKPEVLGRLITGLKGVDESDLWVDDTFMMGCGQKA